MVGSIPRASTLYYALMYYTPISGAGSRNGAPSWVCRYGTVPNFATGTVEPDL